jgi:DNA-3-methyladenine glycosylase II
VKKPDFSASLAVLRRHKEFRVLIERHGPPDLVRYYGRRGIFETLLRSIIGQQVSRAAARAIHARVSALYPGGKPTPALVAKTPPAKLRKAGLSAQKVLYLKDLARHFADGKLEKSIRRMGSADIVETLVAVKGVGVWTVQMLLIFTLHRPDILPTDDLGIKKGFQKVFKLNALPTKREMEALATPWLPHSTVASWYLWRSLDE